MSQEFGQGQATLFDNATELNVMVFVINRLLSRTATVKVVKVMSVTAGEGDLPGTVDVLPLVKQVDGQGNATSHGTVYGLPYFRLQAGGNAVIMDPVVGDFGICVVADRDISAVKANKAESAPGSFRRFDLADGIYLGGILNGAPTQFVKFDTLGMTIQDGNGNQILTRAGFVNIITPVLQVNGVPVTVP